MKIGMIPFKLAAIKDAIELVNDPRIPCNHELRETISAIIFSGIGRDL